jgi:hypothetical protein
VTNHKENLGGGEGEGEKLHNLLVKEKQNVVKKEQEGVKRKLKRSVKRENHEGNANK